MWAYGCNLIGHTYNIVIFLPVRAGGVYDGLRHTSILPGASKEHHGAFNKFGLDDRRTAVSESQAQ